MSIEAEDRNGQNGPIGVNAMSRLVLVGGILRVPVIPLFLWKENGVNPLQRLHSVVVTVVKMNDDDALLIFIVS